MWKLGLLMSVGFGIALPATAGTLYRCVGADGIPNYSSKRVPDAVCKVIATIPNKSTMSATPPAPKPDESAAKPAIPAGTGTEKSSVVAAAAPATPEKRVVFQTASAGAVLTAANVGAHAQVTRGAVYKFEKDGVTHYTNVRPKSVLQAQMLFSYIETCFACSILPGVNFGSLALNTRAYSEEIRSAARSYGVEEAVVRAVIHAESAFRPNARSHKGAQGLMQLIPATALRFGVADAYDPGQNIVGGVKYLAWLMERYGSNLSLVAAAYNAGEGAVDRNGGVPPYAETQRYVQRVGQLAERYRTALAAP